MTEFTAVVVTVSDGVAAGVREDRSGSAGVARLRELGFTVDEPIVIEDGADSVESMLRQLAPAVDLIVTTGGTGLSPRDLTPEGTLSAIDREVPGLSEAMRADTFGKVPFGMLSRGVSGLIGSTLVVNLPGSPKAVEEGLAVIGPVLEHAIAIASGSHGDHG